MATSISVSIPGAATPATASSGSSGSEIAALRKKLQELYSELKDVSSGEGTPEAKKKKAEALQNQIQLVQQQIAALQQAKEKERQQKAEQTQGQQAKSQDAASKPTSTTHLGSKVDTYA
ncbi:FlxA-like family protein [Paracidovorax anthurii]|uniref:FlxA-like protein n=1 Tax=Paracidovorax anthurii TaxID=78229 RepID=A0A328ZHX8_9BURK|nr:FlxA-like family protein [Paracidovorax anthurii]RAR85439.1 FlxA-like protein [Paracidovorax anthurii]